MNKHYFKRILESIITRKKDSLLMFFIIFILSFFIIVSTCISRLGSKISENVKTSMEVNIYTDDLEFKESNANGYGMLVNSTYQNIDDHFKNYCKENDCVYDSSYSINVYSNISHYSEKVDDGFVENLGLYTAISYDAFKSQGLSLSEGSEYFDDNDRYVALVSNSCYIDGEDVKIGDTINVTLRSVTYNFQVIGTFSYGNSLTSSKSHYTSNTSIIVNKDDFFELCDEANKQVNLNRIGINAIDGFRFNELKNGFNLQLSDAIKEKRMLDKLNDYTVQTNQEEYERIVSPSDNLKSLYNIISIVMVIISCLLLINVVTFLNENRLKEYAILLSMGQKKSLSIFSFGIEILLIAFLAITLSLPLGINVAKSSANKLLDSNLKRQERLAKISGSEEDFDIFEKQVALYSEYEVEVNASDIIFVYLINDGFILISCLFAFISISKLKPRQLLLKGK